MIVYLDLVFFINFMFDLLLLLTVKIVLKRNTSFFRIMLGSLIGSLSIFILFINLNSIFLFLFKIIISIFMIIVSFGFKDIKYFLKNMLYLYFISIILGGFLYYLNLEFSYKTNGLIFINNGFSINFILLFILSPIILYLYIKSNKELKIISNYYHTIEIYYNNKVYKYNAYLDTGNKLYDPYFHKPIIILHDSSIKITNPIFIPCKTVNNNSLLKCFKAEKIIIDNNIIKNKAIIALSDSPIMKDNINVLLHKDYFDL